MITDADAMGVGKRYALQRDNFILDPVHDTACFARHDIDTRGLAESLNIDLVTCLAPKRLVWGPYGGGKTHTLMRTMKELGDLTNVQAIRVECPDLSKKARFHDLFRDGIMREMGQDFVVGLLEEAVLQVPMGRRDEYLAALKAKFGDEAIAKAVS